jgi:hypothetical protein
VATTVGHKRNFNITISHILYFKHSLVYTPKTKKLPKGSNSVDGLTFSGIIIALGCRSGRLKRVDDVNAKQTLKYKLLLKKSEQ